MTFVPLVAIPSSVGQSRELEYQLLLARDLKLLQSNDCDAFSQQTVEIKRMLTVLVPKLTAES